MSLAASVLAGKPEVPLPTVFGFSQDYLPALPNYIQGIFKMSLLIVGLIAFAVLVLGGSRYMTSAGDSGKMGEAKSQALAGMLGLIIIFSSYLILGTINPKLVILKPPGFEAAATGVILFNVNNCPNAPNPGNVTQIEQRDYLALRFSSANLPTAIDFAPRSIYFFESAKELEVKFYKEKNYKDANGDPEPFKDFKQDAKDCVNIPVDPLDPDPKSISLEPRLPGVFLYTKAYVNDPDYPWQGKSVSYQISRSILSADFYNNIASVRIKQPSDQDKLKYGAILHGNTDFRGKAEVFMRNWPDLKYTNHNQISWMNHKDASGNPYPVNRIGNINYTDAPFGSVSSITVFKQNPDAPNNAITLCRNPDCADEGGADANLILNFDDFDDISFSYTFYGEHPPPVGWNYSPSQANIIRGIPDIRTGVSGLNWAGGGDIYYWSGWECTSWCPEGVSAVKFDAGNYILLLFKEKNYKGDALILRKSEMVLDVVDFNDDIASMIIIKGQ